MFNRDDVKKLLLGTLAVMLCSIVVSLVLSGLTVKLFYPSMIFIFSVPILPIVAIAYGLGVALVFKKTDQDLTGGKIFVASMALAVGWNLWVWRFCQTPGDICPDLNLF